MQAFRINANLVTNFVLTRIITLDLFHYYIHLLYWSEWHLKIEVQFLCHFDMVNIFRNHHSFIFSIKKCYSRYLFNWLIHVLTLNNIFTYFQVFIVFNIHDIHHIYNIQDVYHIHKLIVCTDLSYSLYSPTYHVHGFIIYTDLSYTRTCHIHEFITFTDFIILLYSPTYHIYELITYLQFINYQLELTRYVTTRTSGFLYVYSFFTWIFYFGDL